MTERAMLASRTFTEADQIRFADVSGDRNPMHLDAVKARRTQAGLPVVHGVHLVLWALDAAARKDVARSPMLRLRANFKRFVALGETVALVLAKQTEANAQLHFVVGGTDGGPDRHRLRFARPHERTRSWAMPIPPRRRRTI